MDDRIFPGLPLADDIIKTETKAFLSVDKVVGRNADVIGCKRMIVFLLQEFYPDWILEQYGAVVGVDHATVIHYRKNFSHLYYGGSMFYTFAFLNLKAKVKMWESFTWDDVYTDIIEALPVPEAKKAAAERLMTSKKNSHYKINNIVVRSFIKYLISQHVTPGEIGKLLGIKTVAAFRKIEIPSKELYLSAVETVFRNKIAHLKSQEAYKKNTYEKRRIEN